MYVCMYVWPTQEMSAVELKHNEFKSRWKKGRQERRGDWGFDEVMFVFCLPGRYSLVFIDEGHQLELFFSINAGAIKWSTLKISTCYSADSVSRPHIISATNFVFLIFGC